MNRNPLMVRASAIALLINGNPMDVQMSAEQIHETMRSRPGWNQRKWVEAVEIAARDLIDDGYTNLVGPRLEQDADWIYQEEL